MIAPETNSGNPAFEPATTVHSFSVSTVCWRPSGTSKRTDASTAVTIASITKVVDAGGTFDWLRQFESMRLSLDQKRVLASAHSHQNRITSRDVQSLLKTEIHGA